MKLSLSLLSCFCSLVIMAQQPIPAKPQAKSVVLIGGTAHLGNGQVIQNSAIGFDNGKIVLVEEASKAQIDRNKYEVVDITGKHVYPGFIAPVTSLGLTEVESIRATKDMQEVGRINPDVRAIIAYNTDSKVTPTVRTNGILLAQITPAGGLISGQSSVVELDGWNWEDASYKSDEGIHLNWPQMYVRQGWWAEPGNIQKENTEKELQKIKSFFSDAKAYSMHANLTEKNLRLESMKGLFDGSKKLYVHADYIKEIIAAVNFTKEFGIKMVLVGGDDSWMVTSLLKENNVPVILNQTHSLPLREDDDLDLPYKLPYLLQQAGVLFCMSHEGFWQQRNLAFDAGTSAAYGLTKEQALMSITSNTAKILGIDKTVGTLETGKDATLIVSKGDALDMMGNAIELAFIRGKNIELTNVQQPLYKKYKGKYGLN
jgi:imidazolonepropionase-like amidohydrolase